jgi:hypothetical protein
LIADANHLAVQLAVITHGQHGDRRAHRGSKDRATASLFPEFLGVFYSY